MVCVYEDVAVSGTSLAGRSGFRQMLADARDGGFDAVLVLRRDRFARNIAEAMLTEQSLLETAGVRVLSHDEPAGNDDTPSAFLMRGMSNLMAEHYSVELSHKTKAGWRKQAEKGRPAGDIPFGYRSAGPRSAAVGVPEEAEALRSMFESYAVGNASLNDLADRLNARGFQPRSKRGHTTFGAKAVRGMLSNRFYIGDITYKGEVVARGQHEPVIEPNLFDLVQTPRAAGSATKVVRCRAATRLHALRNRRVRWVRFAAARAQHEGAKVRLLPVQQPQSRRWLPRPLRSGAGRWRRRPACEHVRGDAAAGPVAQSRVGASGDGGRHAASEPLEAR